MRKRRCESRQAGIKKASESEPLTKRRKVRDDIRTGVYERSRDEPGRCPLYWPGGVRREDGASLVCGCYRERGKAGDDTVISYSLEWRVTRGSAPSGRNREVLSTVAARAGGPVRSSDEALVMGVERRGRLICDLIARATGRDLGGCG